MNLKARHRALQRDLLSLQAASYRKKMCESTSPFLGASVIALLAAQWFLNSKGSNTFPKWKTLLGLGVTAQTWWKQFKNKG